jgi:UPF0755 protein
MRKYKSMSKRQSSGLRGCVILFLAIVCLVAVAGGWAASDLPRWATRTFGQPNSRHGWGMRVYLSAQLYFHRYDLLQPLDAFGIEREFEVGLGESPIQVVDRLEQERLIRNREALRVYLIYSGLDTTLQAGNFKLSPAWSAVEIAQQMQDATPGEVSFRILAGWRLEEVAAALPVNGVQVDPQEFIRAARNPTELTLAVEWLQGTSLEGYLYPDVYQFKRDATIEEVLNAFINRFFEQVPPELKEGFTRQGLDLPQAVTLASIVQREAIVQDEMPMIASVFLNRMAIDMKLDSDPTVQFAVGYQAGRGGWWTNPLTLDDLQVDSPYNTYIYKGLPPGPISNPSLAAMQAVAAPAQTPYYYFRAACDGNGLHNFARTFEEQVQNACP